jgi:hypothetical protein
VTGSTTAASLDLNGLRSRLAEASLPAPTHFETELQRLASQRLGGTTDRERVSGSPKGVRSLRARMKRTAAIAGAFDSPQGFVYVSDAISHRR